MTPDFGTYVQALQRTIEFEEELAEKFGGSSGSKSTTSDIDEVDKGESSDQIVMDIRKKYERKLAARQGNEDDVCDTGCLIYILHFLVPFSVLLHLHVIGVALYLLIL